jgi:hypothetical protein
MRNDADMVAGIPQMAYINAQIMQRAAHTPDFISCVDEVSNHYKIPRFQVINPAYVVSLLYCLIVVPKEIWDLPYNHAVYSKMEHLGILSLFTVELLDPQFRQHPTYYLLQRMRNAVSHVNYSFDLVKARFTFWDIPHRRTTPNFRAGISTDGLQAFLSQVGTLLANLRTATGVSPKKRTTD